MSLTVYTKTPRKFIRILRDAVKSGAVDSWIMDEDGDFTPSRENLRNNGWIKISEIKPSESVIFGLIGRKYVVMTTPEYAVFHTRFAEMLLTHFDKLLNNIEISSLPTSHDKFND